MKTKNISTKIKIEVIEVACKMNHDGLTNEFVVAAVELAFEDESVFELFKKWKAEDKSDEKEKIILGIQNKIAVAKTKAEEVGTFIRFDDLDEISKDIRRFKDSLRVLVDEVGGIKNLSKLTGIPQPSLSRFFNSSAMPRRTTLYKIAKALKKSEVQIGTDYFS